MSEGYIRAHFDDIKAYAGVVEQRLDDSGCTVETVLQDNLQTLALCRRHGVPYVLIDDEYGVNIEL